MTMQQTVDQLSGKHEIGIENYSPSYKSIPRRTHGVPYVKANRETFMTTIPKRKQHIPGPDGNSELWNWKAMKPL